MISKLKSKAFWDAALGRALRTFCQVFVSAIPTSAVLLSEVPWAMVLSTSALAGIVSIAMSIIMGVPEVGEGNE